MEVLPFQLIPQIGVNGFILIGFALSFFQFFRFMQKQINKQDERNEAIAQRNLEVHTRQIEALAQISASMEENRAINERNHREILDKLTLTR